MSKRWRLFILLALLLISACLCFSQLGIMSLGDSNGWTCNIALFLVPVALCVCMQRTLAEGDMLYLYTDGVNEAMDVDGKLFGDDRLMAVLASHPALNARSICADMRRAITEYAAGAEQSDDVTMLALRYGVPPERRAHMELSATVSQLVHAQSFVHEELHRRNAPKAVYHALDIAMEELFCNICRYAYPDATPQSPGEVRVEYEYTAAPPSIEVTLSDDGIPFDPLASTSEGGLGIRMARGSVDDMRYERVDGANVIAFSKGW